MMPERQLVLDLPHREALGREDFFVTPSNAAAVAMIDCWPDWPTRNVLLCGPAGSGKTHLAEVWRQKSGASITEAGALSVDLVPGVLGSGALVVENAGTTGVDEHALFHLVNLARQSGADLLFTSRLSAEAWNIRLPDLATRLKTFAFVAIGAADDELLRAVLVKHFTDRQLAASEDVISFLVSRMPRSLEAARQLVQIIDRRSLTERAEVTRPFVAKLLQEFTSNDLFAAED